MNCCSPNPLVPSRLPTTNMDSSRIDLISSALTMALSNVPEEHLAGRQQLEELNPTSVEFLTLASDPHPHHNLQIFVPAGDEEEEEEEDYPEEEEQTNEEMDDEVRAARELDEIEEANRNGWWADAEYYETDAAAYGECGFLCDGRCQTCISSGGGYGLDWNESGYFD